MKNRVMVRAWEIARGAAVKFGGSPIEYMSASLAQAWLEVRKSAKVTIEISVGSRKHKSWVAKIVGNHERFGLDREFVNPAVEGRMYKTYELSEDIYEVCDGGDRYFISVNGGRIERVGKAAIVELVA